MKNCKNGGKTIIDLKDGPGSDPYRCECADGYTGDLCGRYICIGYHMRGEVISVLSLERRYHILSLVRCAHS